MLFIINLVNENVLGGDASFENKKLSIFNQMSK